MQSDSPISNPSSTLKNYYITVFIKYDLELNYNTSAAPAVPGIQSMSTNANSNNGK